MNVRSHYAGSAAVVVISESAGQSQSLTQLTAQAEAFATKTATFETWLYAANIGYNSLSATEIGIGFAELRIKHVYRVRPTPEWAVETALQAIENYWKGK